MLHLAWIVPLALLIFYIASPRQRGDIAPSRVRRVLAQGLERSRYTVLNDLVIPSGGGTVAIDHAVVSKFGVFVIRSVYAPGLVAGTEVQERWKRRHFGRTHLFDNPLHQARLQAEALEQLLQLPRRAFHPMVVVVGHAGFRHGAPHGVLEAERLIPTLRRIGQPLLSAEQAGEAVTAINSALIAPRGGLFVRWSTVLRIALLFILLLGVYFAFRDSLPAP